MVHLAGSSELQKLLSHPWRAWTPGDLKRLTMVLSDIKLNKYAEDAVVPSKALDFSFTYLEVAFGMPFVFPMEPPA